MNSPSSRVQSTWALRSLSYGTNGGSNFDRDGLSTSARSDAALRTTYVFNPHGSLKSVTDPKAIETCYEYDALGRQTAVINNYVNGTPSGTTGADDVFTRYAYTNGHDQAVRGLRWRQH